MDTIDTEARQDMGVYTPAGQVSIAVFIMARALIVGAGIIAACIERRGVRP